MSNGHIAVVGIGCRFPQADNADQFWTNIANGKASFTPVPRDRWDHAAFFSKNGRDVDKTWTDRGAFIEDIASFAPLHYGIAPRRLEVMDPQHRLLIETTREAIQDAGYETRTFDRGRTGVFCGVSVAEYKNLALARITAMQIASGQFGPAAGSAALRDALVQMTRNVVPVRAFSIPGMLSNMAAASISQTFDLGGPSYTLDAACASASVAIHNAVGLLRGNQIDTALAGGAYLNLTPDNLVAFTKVGAISKSGACRPFDARADGFVQGDGVGVLMLKRLDDALSAGDRIHAIIRGSGCNNDGRGEGPMTPRVQGQVEALRAAYTDADCSPSSIAYFEAHGTGTSIGDPVEVESVGRVLLDAGVDADSAPLFGSVKANVGHTMSAAGLAGLIKAIKVLEHRTAPPQPDFGDTHDAIQLDRWPLKVSDVLRPLHSDGPLRVAASSFGFGGTNAHFVLEEAPVQRTMVTSAGVEALPQAILVTAPTAALLSAHMRELADAVDGASLVDIAFTLNARRKHERLRAVVTADTITSLQDNLRSAADSIDAATDGLSSPFKASTTATVYDAGAPGDATAPKVAFLFPGQGAQRVGLLNEVRTRFPGFKRAFEALEGACEGTLSERLSTYLYPTEVTDEAEQALTATEVCQPTMAALGLSMSALLGELGVTADVSLGHSLGEFAALANGGVLDHGAAVNLVARRGLAMRDLDLADPGTMAAVMGDADSIDALIEDIADVAVANYNRPGQVTISGATASVASATKVLVERGFEVKPLNVACAFHSPLMQDVGDAMQSLLADIEFAEPEHTVASCIAADSYTDDHNTTRSTLTAHATAPVRFTRGLEQAAAAGATVFVQVGAGGMLTGFARATLGREAITTVNLSSNSEDGGLEFVRGMATLGALGAPVRFDALFDGSQPRLISLPATPLERERYWVVRQDAQPVPKMADYQPDGLERGLLEASVTLGDAAPTASVEDPSLVALFRQQAELLETHARIIEDQNRILRGEALAAPVTSTNVSKKVEAIISEPATRVAPQNDSAPAASPTTAANDRPEPEAIKERVFEIVAKVSAFPRASLRDDQRLIDELGFDSLMVNDLGSGLDEAYPDLGGLPQTLFSAKTTVGDIAEHVVTAQSRDANEADADADEAPLSTYRVAAIEKARPALGAHDPSGEVWLVTEDDDGLGAAIEDGLRRRGAKVVRVRFIDDGVAAPDRLSCDAPNVWPRTFAEGLMDAVTASDLALSGYVHAAGLSTAGAPLALLHPIVRAANVARTAIITGLGGQLALCPNTTVCSNLLHACMLGYAKSVARERANQVVRALDIDPGAPVKSNAEWVIDEILSGDLEPEVGYREGRRYVAALKRDTPAIEAGHNEGLQGVVLITGGAGEIASRVALALAGTGPTGIVLLGRRAADARIRDLVADIEHRGTPAVYRSADVADTSSLAAVGQQVTETFGPITCAIHAAGFIADAPVEETTVEALDHISGVKAGGYHALSVALPDLKALIGFSSWAGRFGNARQAGYAAANDLLDRLAINETRFRALSIDWPPWASTEMVRSIPSMVQSAMRAEGVTFVADEEGVDAAVALITSDTAGLSLVGRDLPERRARVMRAEVLDLERHPYLDDHRLESAPVLPLASASDLMTWAARQALEIDGPIAIENLELIRGVEVEETVSIRVCAEGTPRGGARIELWAGDVLAYRAEARAFSGDAPMVRVEDADEALPLDLATFYDRHIFHGPMLQGIETIDRMTKTGICGCVKTTPIARWMPATERVAWAADPLVVDSSFQLAGYWVHVHHARAGYPLGYRRMIQLRPFTDESVRVQFVLDEVDEDRFVGTVRYEDADGAPYAVIEGLTGRLVSVDADAQPDKSNGVAIEVPAENRDIAQFPEVEMLGQRLEMASLIGLDNPYFNMHEGTAKNRSVIDGVEMLNYSSYNYLGFSGHPEVVAAAKDAVDKYGTSVSASRIASGERPIHRQLEQGLAEHIGVDDSIVFVSGHATNVTTVGHMLGKEDIVLHDALIHDSILQGIYLSGAARRPFPHGDLDALERTLSQIRGHYRRALICAEGIYSMDGDMCDLPRLIELKKRFGCMLLIDEAHSIGVLGEAGRGIAHAFDGVNPRDVDLWMGTLSKSFASCGGYIAGSDALVRFLKYTAPGFVYSAGISPANCAAALKSLELMHREPETVEQLRQRSRLFLDLAQARGVDTGLAIGAAVVPAIVGNSMDCMKLSAALFEHEINVQPIVYPAVEDDAARLRFFLSSTHTEDEIRRTVDILAGELAKLQGDPAADPAPAPL